jgi:hypothetical protein
MDQLLNTTLRKIPYAGAEGSPDKAWSEAEYLDVAEMYNNHISMTLIGEKYNVTRSSISGMINRLRRRKLIHTKPLKPKMPRVRKHYTYSEATVTARSRPHKRRRLRLRLIESDTAVTFAELQPWHCKWPFGDPRHSDFHFCGCRRLDSGPYCENHAAMSGRYYVKE